MTAFTRQTLIRFAHCDAAGLIFYPQFFALVNEMVEDWFAGPLDHSFRALHIDARKGVPTVHLAADFLLPVRLGDVLEQSLVVVHIGKSSCRLNHTAHVRGERVSRFDHTIVFADLATMQAEPWPDELCARMAPFVEGA
ncbi:MAG: acyl-CoA thioesterase [Hyphomonadaceae bacterium]